MVEVRWARVALLFLEQGGMGGVERPDFQVLARRYGYEFGPTYGDSGIAPRLDRLLYLDKDGCAAGECRSLAAHELAAVALELAGMPATPEAVEGVARCLLSPPTGPRVRPRDGTISEVGLRDDVPDDASYESTRRNRLTMSD